ncbi:MAG: S9 family peptidase, partial [Alkalimonas sp.]|nr:S9 family peptidase [Alkalimonas sp.]
MKNHKNSSRLALCLALAIGTLACSQPSVAPEPVPMAVEIPSSTVATDALRPLTFSDVMQFRDIKERSVSANQQAMVYTVEPDYGDSTGYVVHLMTGQQFSVPYVDRGQLNADGSFALFRQRSPLLLREQATDKAARDALAHDAVLLNTASGEQQLFQNIDRFAFTGDGHQALLLARKADNNDKTQLLSAVQLTNIGRLEQGKTVELGQVSEFAVAEQGTLVAYVLEFTDHDDDSLQLQQVVLWDAAFDRRFELTPPSAARYQQLTFSADGQQLVFFAGDRVEKNEEVAQQLWHWPSEQNQAAPHELKHEGWLLSAQQAPRFSEDGRRV